MINYQKFGLMLAQELVLTGDITLTDARKVLELAATADPNSSYTDSVNAGISGLAKGLSMSWLDAASLP